ncbi:MAG: hypothetical protein ACREMR_08870, partial [Gemmatimonadales bacterium]
TVRKLLALPPASARASKVLTAKAFDAEFDAFRREMQERLAECLASEAHHAAMALIRGRTTGR